MQDTTAIHQLLRNLDDLAPTPGELLEALPLLRESARQLGFRSDITNATLRALARFWLHSKGGYWSDEGSIEWTEQIRVLLQEISLREHRQPYDVAQASEEIAKRLGINYDTATAQVSRLLDSDEKFMCDAERTQFTYMP